ncbi:hypothetical protein RUM43_005524 [Polyplax serrata]|uniref:Uncharacterized protein n=1 Tax=Polyplax serrata TaxID=468196 RepID=A0AAN8NRC6_POLSC
MKKLMGTQKVQNGYQHQLENKVLNVNVVKVANPSNMETKRPGKNVFSSSEWKATINKGHREREKGPKKGRNPGWFWGFTEKVGEEPPHPLGGHLDSSDPSYASSYEGPRGRFHAQPPTADSIPDLPPRGPEYQFNSRKFQEQHKGENVFTDDQICQASGLLTGEGKFTPIS